MKTNFGINKTNRDRAKNLAEKMYNQRDDLENKLLTWDRLTTEMNFDLPSERLEVLLWKKYRTTWIDEVNKQFAIMEAHCHLKCVPRKGAVLLINKSSVPPLLNAEIKNIMSKHKRVRQRTGLLMKQYPKYAHVFKMANMMLENSQMALLGNVFADQELSKNIDTNDIKRYLK